jgi:hypothetical protein
MIASHAGALMANAYARVEMGWVTVPPVLEVLSRLHVPTVGIRLISNGIRNLSVGVYGNTAV